MRLITWVALGSLLGLAGCDDAELTGAKAEVKKLDTNLDLPAVPSFDLPPQGSPHNVREMRLMGASLLGTDVDVKGYVVWIYDCAEHGGREGPVEGETYEDRVKFIEKNPQKCWLPHFVLGAAADTKPAEGIQVVEVPRPLRPDELKKLRRLPKAEREERMPDVPEMAVGDEVIVSGTWTRRSEKGFANSIGLIQYKALRKEGEPPPEEPAP